MRVVCHRVRLKELISISDKCYKAVCFDGKSDLIPKSQVYEIELTSKDILEVWLPEWILHQKKLQYSPTHKREYDKGTGKQIPKVEIIKNIPQKITNLKQEPDNELIR